MSLQIGAALREGGYRLASRTGAILTVAYVLLYAVYMVAFNDIVNAAYAEIDVEIEALSPALGADPTVSGLVVLACLVLLSWLTVVAVRAFVADERDGIPRELLVDRAAFATANLVVGGIVLTVLLTVGFMLLVVPGVFLAVSLIFMTMYVAVEDDNFLAAMRESWRLTKGERLSIFLLFLVVFAVVFAISIAMGIVSMIAVFAGASVVVDLLNVLVLGPAIMYNLAVLSVAFVQIRDDEGPGATAGTPTGTPAGS